MLMAMSNEFFLLLEKTGYFDELEIKIIKAMVKLREKKKFVLGANEISKESKLSVTNAYKYLYSLQEKGIVESKKDKNKLFWLTESSNPFPRIFSKVGDDYLRKKIIFSGLREMYDRFIPKNSVWLGERIKEQYKGGFIKRAAFLIDAANEEILITTGKFIDNYILLDALKRALARGVKVKVIAEQVNSKIIAGLNKINLSIRMGFARPDKIVVDDFHSIVHEPIGEGIMYLNHKINYKEKFNELWKQANEI